jgi:putative hydrolase of the HAD superfamily
MTTTTNHTDDDESITVDAVLFDLDRTLVDYDQDEAAILRAAFDQIGVEPFCTDAALESAAADGGVAVERDHERYWTGAFERAAERYGGDPDLAPRLYEAYGEVFDRTRVHRRPGATAALEAARSVGPVGLVTNGDRAVQEAKLATTGLDGAFETAIFADEVSDPKPATAPFEAALAALGVAPADALYVGDSLRHDVGGASAAGLRVAWCPPDGGRAEAPSDLDPEPDCVLRSLHDLVGRLDAATASGPGADDRGGDGRKEGSP